MKRACVREEYERKKQRERKRLLFCSRNMRGISFLVRFPLPSFVHCRRQCDSRYGGLVTIFP